MKLNTKSWHFKFNSLFSNTPEELSSQEFNEYKEHTIQRLSYCIFALPLLIVITTIIGVPFGAYLCNNYDIDLNSITALLAYFGIGVIIEILFLSLIKIITTLARKFINIKE